MIAYADNVTLADVRASVIASGVIPDTYLIEPTGTYWDSNNATAAYNFLKSWIEAKDESVPSSLFQNKVNRALFNTAILFEGRADSLHQVAALVTAKERALGTYNESGYLKKYHDHIINNHNISNTVSGIDTTLNQTLGDMAPLAGEITSIANRAASIASIPDGLLESDLEYWIDVEIATYCKLDKGVNHPHCTPGAGNQTGIVSGESHGTVSADWYWRAFSCLSTFRGHGVGAVCSGTASESSSSNFNIDVGPKTVAGMGITSRLTVTNALEGTAATISGTLSEGTNKKTVTGSESNKVTDGETTFKVEDVWRLYTEVNHPCYSNNYPDVWCIPLATWTFSGSAVITIPHDSNTGGDTGGDINTCPAGSPVIETTAPRVGYIGKKYYYDVNASGSKLKYYAIIKPDDTNKNMDNQDFGIDTTSGELTWTIPDDKDGDNYVYAGEYTVTVEVRDCHGQDSEQEYELLVVKNNVPVLTVEIPGQDEDRFGAVEIQRHAGTLYPEVRYTFTGTDDDPKHDLTLTVSEPPTRDGGALTNCKTGKDEEGNDLEMIHEDIGSKIAGPKKTSITGDVCIVGLNAIQNDDFVVQLSDGIDVVMKTIQFTIIDTTSVAIEYVKKLGTAAARGLPTVHGAIVAITFHVGGYVADAAFDHHTMVWRCERDYTSVGYEDRCDPKDPPECVRLAKACVFTSGNSAVSGNSAHTESGWTLIANVTNTVNITINDTGLDLEPNKVYTYVARIFVGNKSSDIIPLGNVTTPADGPPVLTLREPINMTVLLGSPYVEPGYEAIDFYEGNVTDRVRTQTHETIDTNKEGTYWIFYYVRDSAGHQSATQVRTVTVAAQDILPPTITLIDGVNITVPASVPYVDSGYTAIDAVDGNITGSVTVTGTVNTDVLGTYMLQYSVSDSAGNTATQSRTVIVADMTPPTITLIGGARIPTLLSAPYIDPGYEAIDNIDGNVTKSVVVTGTVDTSTNGTYILQYDVSDSVGNAAITQNRTVIVTSDMTPPTITLKGHPRIEVAAGIPYVDPGYTAIDDIDGNITERVVVSGLLNTDVLHAYMLHYDVSDSSGNAAITQNRIVSVVDMMPPVFTLIGGARITVPASVPYVDPGYTAIDNIYGNVTHRVQVSGTVNTDALGSYTLLYFASDGSGNLGGGSRIVIVADLTPPVITLKGGSELQITKGTTYVEPGYAAIDNIDGNVTSSVVVTGTVDVNTPGMYTISYDVTDGAGNAAITQNRTITVMGDDTPPIITLKGQQAITIEGHTDYVEPGYTATDDIDGNITDMVVVTGTVNTAVLDTYTLNYDVSDSSGNAAITQNRTITVVDTTPPVITLKGGSELQITKGTTYVEPGYTATDNIDGNVTSSVVVTGTVDTSMAGVYTISYEVTDGAGNVANKVLTVTVVLDTVTPVITLSDGSSITLPMGPTFTEPGYMATDNIDGNITSMVDVTGTVNPLIPGTYTISYEVTDSSGNTGQQTRTVTISPPTDTTQYCNNMTLAQLMTSGKYNIINKMFSSESNIKGTDGADLIIVGNNGPTIEGRGGDDCIIGGTGNDTILGQGGNDMIFGNDGDDTIRGGPGHDHLWGQNGNDIMHGGENGDTMYGGADADTMYGGPGRDTIRGGAGNDQIWGLGGNDTIYGDAGDDVLYAGPGIDTIYGGPGTDTIESGESDTVHEDDSTSE